MAEGESRGGGCNQGGACTCHCGPAPAAESGLHPKWAHFWNALGVDIR